MVIISPGIVCINIISNLHCKFAIPRKFTVKRLSGGTNKKFPTKNGEESSLADKVIEISTLELVIDILEIVNSVSTH